MKYILLHILALFSATSIAQTPVVDSDIVPDDLLRAEMARAQKKILFKANAKTGNYDLKYHRMQWEVDPAKAQISGTVTTYFEALEDMSEITFDLAPNMSVSQVLQRGSQLEFVHTLEGLTIQLGQTQSSGRLDSLSIRYSGNPVSSGFGSFEIDTHGSQNTPVLWTLSEPYGAKGWWPCKQDLVDKIDSIDVYIRHPSAYKAASNGILIAERGLGTQVETHWRHRYPIPAYLIAIAVTNYSVYSDPVNNADYEVVNYVYPENLSTARIGTSVTPAIMELYNTLFGTYPFAREKYGHAEFGWGGGMEHTTMTFMGGWSRMLVAHELAHQWFGNKVTCGSWQDIWLNEGFATYLDGLVREDFDGEEAFTNWRKNLVQSITSSPGGSVFVTDTSSVSRIFDGRLSYRKGAMLLHMLRYKLGDDDFFTALRNYLDDPDLAYGYARTDDLQEHLEAVSNKDLGEFFQDWLYGQGYPVYEVIWHQNQENGTLRLQVNQEQSHPSVDFFEMPLPVTVGGPGGESEMLRLEVSENGQLFHVQLPFEVVSVDIDPDAQLISRNNSAVLGVDEQTLQNDIKVFPNPASSVLNIRNSGSSVVKAITIYDILGKKVIEEKFPSGVIGIERLRFGLHLVVINTDRGILRKTILKK